MKNTCFVLQCQRQASAEVPLCSKAASFFLLLRTSFLPAQIPLAAAQWALWEKLLAPASHPGPALSGLFLDSSVRGTPAFCQDAEEVGVVLLTIWHSAGGSVHTLAVWNHIQSSGCCVWKQNKQKGRARNVHCLYIWWGHSLAQGNQEQGQFCFLFSQEKSVLLQRGTGTSKSGKEEILCVRGYCNHWRSIGMFLGVKLLLCSQYRVKPLPGPVCTDCPAPTA